MTKADFDWANLPSMFNLTLLLFYLGVLVVITSLLSLRTRDSDPMLGGRNMPWWLVGASILGTDLSSVAFLLIPVIGYMMSVPLIVGSLLEPFAAIIVSLFFVKFLRTARDASIYTLLKDRFGIEVSLYASGCFIFYYALRAGLILCLVGQALHSITGADPFGIILSCGMVVIFYTYMTGIEGVIWTDLVQTVLLAVAGLLALFFVGSSVLESVSELGLGWEDLGFMLREGAKKGEVATEPLGLVLLFFITASVADFICNQAYGQRYLVARSDADAQKGLLVAGALIPFILGTFVLIGVGLFVFYNLNPTLIPEGLPRNQVFGYFIANSFPSGLLGVAVVGLLAAAMSSIDTGINSSSTVFYCNFWEPFSQKTESKTVQNLDVMRKCSLLFGVFFIGAACFIYKYSESLVEVWLKGGALILQGLLGLYILMRVSKGAGRKSGIFALVCGMSFLFWATLSGDIPGIPSAPFHYMWGLPVGTVIMVVAGLIGSRVFNETPATISEPFIHSETARQSVAQKRKRAKKNMFADSLRPKPSYQLYAGMGVMAALFIWNDGDVLGLEGLSSNMFLLSGALLFLAMIGPFFIKNHTSNRYLFLNLALLTFALPFAGAVMMFNHPEDLFYSGLFVGTIAVMGTMVGWTMLGLGVTAGTCFASIWVIFTNPNAAAPEHWMLVMLGVVAVFVYFVMDAAKEKVFEEKYLGKVNVIVSNISGRIAKCLLDLKSAGKNLGMTELAQVTHGVEEIAQAVEALEGATEIDPEEKHMELSVRTSLGHAINRISLSVEKETRKHIAISEDSLDFHVLGSREVFENIIRQILENGVYYIRKGQASQIVCHLDRKQRILTISNDGPAVEPKHVPHIFEMGYTTKKDASMGLGLTYAKKMLEGMRAGIRMTSKPYHNKCEFKIYFPFSYDGVVLDDEKRLGNNLES